MGDHTVRIRRALMRPIVLACVISLAALVHGSPAATTQAAGTVGNLQAISCLAVGNTHAVTWNGMGWTIEPTANLPGVGNPFVADLIAVLLLAILFLLLTPGSPLPALLHQLLPS